MLFFFYILFVLIGSAYTFLIMYYTYGWIRIPVFKVENKEFDTFISVIIPARNEEKNIRRLLTCLRVQNYPLAKFEIIVVDDHSEDNTAFMVTDFGGENILLYHLEEDKKGKKQAIYFGVQKAKGSLIVTTDADSSMDKEWIKSIVSFYEKYHPDMIVGPVVFEKSESMFGKMQSLEFMSLIGSGAGAIGNNKSIMCNGANLAYEREELINNLSLLNDEVASGDDVFFMLNLKRNGKKIMFLKCSEAVVKTEPVVGLTSFIQQRKRWVSKSRLYRDKDVIATSIMIFFINATLFGLFIGSFINSELIYIFLGLLILKLIVDFPILYTTTGFFKRRRLMIYFVPVQVLYFIYISLISIIGMIGRYRWKERKVK